MTDLPPTETCRVLLLQIAAYLERARPEHLMWAASMDLFAGQFASERFGIRSDLVAEAEAEILGHAPEVVHGTTRKQYAELLRDTAGS